MTSQATSSVHDSLAVLNGNSQEGHVPRSSYLEEYSSKCRPLSAGMRPRTLLQKVVQAAGLSAEADSDVDVDVEADTWVLDGWGEEPSVPPKACQVANKLVPKWARNLPCALAGSAASTGPGMRRIASAGTHRSSPGRGRRQPSDNQNQQRRRRVPAAGGSEAAEAAFTHTRQVPGRGAHHRSSHIRPQQRQTHNLDALGMGEESDGGGPSWPHTTEPTASQPCITRTSATPPRHSPAGAQIAQHGSPPKAPAAGRVMGSQTQQLVKLLGTGSSPVQAHPARRLPPAASAGPEQPPAAGTDLVPLERVCSGWSQSQDERVSGCEELLSDRRTPSLAERPSFGSPRASGSSPRVIQDLGPLGGRRPGYGTLTPDLLRPLRPAVHAPIDPLHGPSMNAATTARAVALAAGVAASARVQAGAATTATLASQAAQAASAAAQLAAARSAAKAKLQADLQVLQRLHQMPRSPSPSIPAVAQSASKHDASVETLNGQPVSVAASAQRLFDRLTAGCSDDVSSRAVRTTGDVANKQGSHTSGTTTVPSLGDAASVSVAGARRAGVQPAARQPAPTTVQQLELCLPGANTCATRAQAVTAVNATQPNTVPVQVGAGNQGIQHHSSTTTQDITPNQTTSYAAVQSPGVGRDAISTVSAPPPVTGVTGSPGAGLGPGPPITCSPLQHRLSAPSAAAATAAGRGCPAQTQRAVSSPPAGPDAPSSRRCSRASGGQDGSSFLSSALNVVAVQPGALCMMPTSEVGSGKVPAEHAGKLPPVGRQTVGLEVISAGYERRQSLQRMGSDKAPRPGG